MNNKDLIRIIEENSAWIQNKLPGVFNDDLVELSKVLQDMTNKVNKELQQRVLLLQKETQRLRR